MSKVVKNLMISEIRQRIGEYREVVVLDASKVSAVAANKLRLALRKKNIRLLGVKNAVARKALSDIGLTGLGQVLTGPSTIAFGGEDIVALAREMAEAAQQIKELEIKGGAIGATALTPKNVEELSKSKGRAEVLSDLVAQILAPGANLAAALLGPGGRVAGAIKAMGDKDGGDAPAA